MIVAAGADHLAELVYTDVRPYLLSQDVEVTVDLETMTGSAGARAAAGSRSNSRRKPGKRAVHLHRPRRRRAGVDTVNYGGTPHAPVAVLGPTGRIAGTVHISPQRAREVCEVILTAAEWTPMTDDLVLFGIPTQAAPESLTACRTRRQAAMLAAGIHPLSAAVSKLRLHPEAAPYGDLRAAGRHCGNCIFRRKNAGDYPRRAFGDGVRASHGAATDCRD
ncbi:hypothetical protein ACFQ08_01745 [Streptosporangium algeriense]|uniref:Uncharacterized protein n=1 Tax=Streptosporangium algeriense TaxID=1682748 RepID=A0ABW3DHB5_9ACTN